MNNIIEGLDITKLTASELGTVVDMIEIKKAKNLTARIAAQKVFTDAKDPFTANDERFASQLAIITGVITNLNK